MVLDLDLATEQRIQRQLDGLSYSAPADVINRALDLLEADEQDRIGRRASIVARLQESYAQAERGETFSPEEVRARLARQREEHLSSPWRDASTCPIA